MWRSWPPIILFLLTRLFSVRKLCALVVGVKSSKKFAALGWPPQLTLSTNGNILYFSIGIDKSRKGWGWANETKKSTTQGNSITDFWARVCKRLRRPGIDPKESIFPAYVAWRAGTSNRVVEPARLAGNRFLGSLKGLLIRSRFHFSITMICIRDASTVIPCGTITNEINK